MVRFRNKFLRIPVSETAQDCGQKIFMGWVGFRKSYVIYRPMPTTNYKVGGVKKGQKHAYVIFEWYLIFQNSTTVNILNKKDKNIYYEKK